MIKGTALITGASSGIGEALAKEFADHNYNLIVTARREQQLQELADQLRDEISVQVVSCDLSTPEGMQTLLSAIGDTPIDVLVNNAGVAYSGNFQQQQTDDINNLLNLNIIALTNLTHELLPQMINRGAGRILNVASVASFQPVPSLAAYAASKAYVLSLTEALSEELQGLVSMSLHCAPDSPKPLYSMKYKALMYPQVLHPLPNRWQKKVTMPWPREK